MQTLKRIISKYVYRIVVISVLIILITMFALLLIDEQNRAYEDAKKTFMQMEQVLLENQEELTEITEEYAESCLHAAETVSRIIENDRSALNSLDKLKEIANEVQVDEIHVFDKSGRIFAGTEPAYYGYTMDSGEQMEFFKPMLTNKNLKLVQEITENTTEQKLMQYSAVWSSSADFIIQIGRNPTNVINMTEKNKLSYIFSLFRVDTDVNYYAIDSKTGIIVGSSNVDCVGNSCSVEGFDFDNIKSEQKWFYERVNGHYSLCVFQKMNYDYIGRVISMGNLYGELPMVLLIITICLIIVSIILVNSFTLYMDMYVVNEIHDVIEKLKSIADGNLDEMVDIQSSLEFHNLSKYINRMVQNRLKTNQMEHEVNETLRAAMSTGDPEKSLNTMLECLCKSLGGKRAYIYEKNQAGGNDNTYEWAVDESYSQKEYSQNLPPQACEGLYKKFDEQEYFVYENVDDIKTENINRYEKLKSQNIQEIAIVPLYDDNNKVIGFYGIDDPTTANISYTANTLRIMGHFIESVIKVRNLVKDLKQISYLDQLTQIGNRHALWEYIESIDLSASIGIVYCDITGLKRVNDEKGHEAGDKLITSSCDCMKDSLKESCRLFRLGGDELLGVFSGTDESEFWEKVKTLKKSMDKYSVNLAVGPVWESNCSEGINNIISRAEVLMYKDKAEYYSKNGIERRR